ncbi:hypothetical protein AB1E18_019234 [Capra hircus]
MAWGPGPLTQSRPNTVAMPKRGKRLKVTVVDSANSDPAIVRSGRVKKAVANAVQQEASQVPSVEALSGAGKREIIHERTISRKKKKEYPIDIWLLLAPCICPENAVNFSLICKNAWTLICTATFWIRLYSVEKLHCLQACVIRSLDHMYEPSAARISKNPAIPKSTSSILKNSKCLLFWCRKIVGNRQEPMWEFNFKFKKQSPRLKSKCMEGLQPPIQYQDVHNNPDHDCCLLQVTTLNFIFIPIVRGMLFTLFTISVSTDMQHH